MKKGIEIMLSILLFGFFLWLGIHHGSFRASFAYAFIGIIVYTVLIQITRSLFKPSEK